MGGQMNVGQVLNMLKEEAALCNELAALRGEQRVLIDAGDAETLLDVLAKKQQVIQRIGLLEEQLGPVKANWEAQRGSLPAAQRVAVAEAFRQVQLLLEDLIAKETEDAEALAARKAEVTQEMDSFDRKRQLQAVYHAPGGRPESRLVDRKDA